MDGDLQKRNTDCVYFLASPLTCKKRSECEYRHSDSARLNPRDCWYWLSGNCLNPNCSFRHPPLEAKAEQSKDSAKSTTPPLNSLTPPQKQNKTTTVPCHFYFQGFCNRGVYCTFLHDPAKIPKKNVLTSSHVSAKIPDVSTRAETPAPARPVPRNPDPITPVPSLPADSAAAVMTTSATDDTDLERRESSPGFDVLVDGQTDEEADYGGEPVYPAEDDREPGPEEDYDVAFYAYDGDKRKLASSPGSNGRCSVDLREHLRKRRQMGDGSVYCSPAVPNGNHADRPQLLSEVSRRARARDRLSVPEAAPFTAPKTLSQIQGARQNTDGRPSPSSSDFERPKRLSEIIQEKRRVFLHGGTDV